MAITPDNNETFYREVDEELRREQMTGAWQRYRYLIIGGALLLLAAIAGFLWWQQEREVRAGGQGEILTGAFEDVQTQKAGAANAKLNQLVEEGSPGYRASALLSRAAIALDAGKDADAVAAYKAVVADEDLPEPYRNLALIRQTAVEFDSLQPSAVVARLRPLATPGNPWFGSAGELVAAAHLKDNKPQLAAPIFAAMAKDETLPPTLRSRAVQMAGALGVDAVQVPEGGAAGATKEANQ